MKTIGWFISFSFSLTLAVGPLSAGAGGAAGPDTGEIASRIDGILSDAYPAKEPGAAVFISKGSTILLKKGYGLADTERKVRVTAETVFRLASVTKMFTATGVLMLAERGALSLDDPFVKYLPDYPAAGATITVQHLLSHTSGVADYLDRPNNMEWVRNELSVAELIDSFKNRPLSFSPGARNVYSNSNYILLGAIIEKVSGQSFGEFVDKNIFKPVGMTCTSCAGQLRDIPRLAEAYEPVRTVSGEPDWSRMVAARPYTMSALYAAGGCLSSIEDMARFHEALFKGELISSAMVARSFTRVELTDGSAGTMSQGGWQLDQVEGRRAAMRGGALPVTASTTTRRTRISEFLTGPTATTPPWVPVPSALSVTFSLASSWCSDENLIQTGLRDSRRLPFALGVACLLFALSRPSKTFPGMTETIIT